MTKKTKKIRKIYLNTLKPEEVIKRLKAGEVVKRKTSCDVLMYSMIDGVLTRKDSDSISLGSCIVIDDTDDYYFEEVEKFEITETGLYKTRHGERAFVSEIDDDCQDRFKVHGCVEGDRIHRTWQADGSYCTKEDKTGWDIVAKWED